MATIPENLQAVRRRICMAAEAAGRAPADVQLIAVSKTWPAEQVLVAWAAGQRAYGENYVQEALDKIEEVGARLRVGSGVTNGTPSQCPEWHFVGPIQTNKTRVIAQHFDWVHSVDRLKVAQRLAQARPEDLPALQLLLQVNVSGEATKSGVDPAQALTLAREVARLPRIRLRGLMAIPEPTLDPALQHSRFRMLRELQEFMIGQGLALDQLSMGMSEDLEAAVAEGATIVRIGTAIFGARR